MKARAILAAALCLAVAAAGHPQTSKSKPKKKDDDLPDVALQIPEDTRPEVKAIIKAQVLALASKKASERSKAAQVLGELGEQGKPVRGLLCRALLDPYKTVRVAAADALKAIDPKMQYLAVKYVTETSPSEYQNLLQQFQKLKEDAEPLTPLVAHSAMLSAAAGSGGATVQRGRLGASYLADEITTLSWIAKNDLATCKLVGSALDNGDGQVRAAAMRSLVRMKHGRRFVSKIILLLKAEAVSNQVTAIEALTALADQGTEEDIVEAINALRYHENEGVRKAVNIAVNKLENKQNP